MSADPIPFVPAPSVRRLILVGNPNVGKSLLFNALTGHYVNVSNYPGTTIEITRAVSSIAGESREVVDTPGTNSLIPQSEDEKVTRDILLTSESDEVVQVGDIKNLRRTLLLTLQIAELGIPFSLCLNMSDEAREHGIEVDSEALSGLLGIDVVEISALRRWNIEKLKRSALGPRSSTASIAYAPSVEDGVARLSDLLNGVGARKRAISLAILAGDETIGPWLRSRIPESDIPLVEAIREEVQASSPEPLWWVIQRDRLAAADRLLDQVYRGRKEERRRDFRSRLGAMTMHPIWGVPFLLLVLFVAWWFVGKLGAGDLVDFVENVIFNRYVNPWTIRLFDLFAGFPHSHEIQNGFIVPGYTMAGPLSPLQSIGKFVHDLMVGPYGIITMALTYAIAIVLPVVTTFFVFFGLMEDSGYLPRLAVVLNRLFKGMGLNGKAVLPMVLGLGCDTMATLTTRILETKKEAIIVTLLLALGVPCSAQLGVIMAMLAPLGIIGVAVWLGVIGGTIFFVGWLSAKLIPGRSADFILEVPPLRVPRIGNILIKVMARTEWYLKEAVPLFVIGTLMLYLFDFFGLLARFQRILAPLVVGTLQLPAEAANAFLIGFLRRDYGAAGLFMMQREGQLDAIQTLVSLTVITLFIPCVANLLMIVKERGTKMAVGMTAFIVFYAFGIGWLMNVVLRAADLPIGR